MRRINSSRSISAFGAVVRRRSSTSLLVVVVVVLVSLLFPCSQAAIPSCTPGSNLTEFNNPLPPQTATILNLEFTCIYNDFGSFETTYQMVPSPVIRIEPGNKIGFYSNPPDIYDWVDQDGGTTLSLAHNPFTLSNTSSSFVTVEFVITWPADQLEGVTMVGDNGANNAVLLVEGFTALQSIDVSGAAPTGLEAYLSTEGTVALQLRGEMALGAHVHVVDGTTTELTIDVENGSGDIEISGTSVTGEVHAANIASRTGTVSVDGVGAIMSTGEGPGLFYANDCDRVEGDCLGLDTTLQAPDTECQATEVCLTLVATTSQPVRVCTQVDGGTPPQCQDGTTTSSPTEAPGSGGESCGENSKRSERPLFLAVFVSLLLCLPIQLLMS